MSVSIQQIKELRERTSAGMGDCKKALEEASGNMDQAVEIIIKKGQAKSAKRAGKIAAEGEVRCEVFDGGKQAAVIEVNIETDFSARNDRFKGLVDKAMAAVEGASVDQPFGSIEVGGKTLEDLATEVTGALGEKITLRRFDKVTTAGKPGFCHSYVHLGGRIGVIIAIEAENAAAADSEAAKTFADETCMQIAAMTPLVLRRADIDETMIAKQREIFEAQLREDPKPKPEKVWPKIIEGKLDSWYSEIALLDQESAQHKAKIDDLRQQAGKAAGGELTITRFVRYELGEGIERQKDDLRAGVAELLEQ
jgi:elongation factor Ts